MINKYTYSVLFFFLTCLAFGQSIIKNSQQIEKCKAHIIHNELMNTDAIYRQSIIQNEIKTQNLLQSNRGGRAAIYTIPVVVHVINYDENIGSGTNISDAQIQSAITALNQDFRKMAGTNGDGGGVDCEIEFCLAVRDPNNQPHSGINRIDGRGVANYTSQGITSANEVAVKDLKRWDRTRFYNIWIVAKIDGQDQGGTQGYAYFPTGAGAPFESKDGAVILYNAFGTTGNVKGFTNRNRTATHEIGHGLNLYHTFEGDGTGTTCPTGNQCGSNLGDCCSDTPPHKRTANSGCNNVDANCSVSPSLFEHNYMDYSSEACQNAFTSQQKNRMRLALETYRSGLITSNGCTPVIQPTSNFTASATSTCQGNGITFTDMSTNGPNSWSWTFSGGTPSTSSSQNPVITYNTPGTYSVTLTASNNIGTGNTETKTSYITIYNTPLTACTPITTDLSTPTGIGITNVTFNTINNTTDDAVADAGFIDNSCSMVTVLTAGNSYPLSVTLGNFNDERVRAYIDYNNNGSFTDPGEQIFSLDNVQGIQTTTVNTPVNAVKNKLLRMRIIDDIYFNTVNSCSNPQYGQAEDYGVYFYSPPTPPVADFSASSTSICEGESITFTDQSTNIPTSWAWSINGGSPSSSTQQNPSATFAAANNYDITLTATNDDGSDSKTISITVKPKPTAPITGNNGPICENQVLTLTASDITNASYSWSGQLSFNSTNPNPTVSSSATMAMSGTYSVTATVDGCSSSPASTIVTVNQNDNATISYSTNSFCKNGSNPIPTITGTTGGAFSSTAGLIINTSNGELTLASSNIGPYAISYNTTGSCPFTASQNITINDFPTFLSLSSQDASCGGNNGSITASGDNGTPTYTYSIDGSNFQNDGNFTSIGGGLYTITVKDALGCSNSSNITVTDLSGLSASITSQTNISCFNGNNGSITALGNGTGGYTYSIDGVNFQNDGTFSSLSQGDYTITVKDQNNCTAIASITLTEPDELTLSATSNDATCGLDNGSITANGNGGTGSLIYSKDGTNFQASNIFNDVATGVYTVTVKDENACITTFGISVSDLSGLSASITSQTNISCFNGNNGSITALGNGTGGYTYSIDGVTFQNDGTFSSLSQGDYTITVKDQNNCTFQVSTTLTQPDELTLSATSNNATCGLDNGSITANGNGGTGALEYSKDGTNFQVSNIFNNVATGVYTVTVKDENACITTFGISVSDLSGLSASITSQTNISCFNGNNGSITALGNGTGGYTYSIDGVNFQNDGTFSNLTQGDYTITVKDQNNCTFQVSTTLTQPDELTLSATSNNATCGLDNGSINANGNGGTGSLVYSKDGTNFQASNIFNDVATGVYTVTVKDENACITTFGISVSDQSGLSLIINNQADITCSGFSNGTVSVTGNGSNNYTYSIDGGTFQVSGDFIDVSEGNHLITVKDINNCTYSQTIIIYEPDLIEIIISTTDASCGNNNGSITASASGGTGNLLYSIDGTNYQPSGTFNTVGGGVYSIRVKDENDCVQNKSATVTDLSGLSASITSQTNISCYNGNNGSITALGNGTGGYTYSIDGVNFQNDGTFSSLSQGDYTLSVKDQNNCTVTVSTTLTEPATNLSIIELSTTGASCNTNNGAIEVEGSGGTGSLTFNLNGGMYQVGTTFNSLSAGNYIVSVKDDNGCTSAISSNVEDLSGLSISILSQTNVTCYGGNNGEVEVLGSGTSGYEYSMDGTNFQFNGMFSNLSAGLYIITLKDVNNCSITQAVTISQPSQVNITANNIVHSTCGDPNGQFTLSADGGSSGYTYSINGINYQANNIYTGLVAGSYDIFARDASGCIANNIVSIDDLNGLSLNIVSTSDVKCYGGNTGSINTSGSGSSGYKFSIDAINFTSNGEFIYLSSGVYNVMVKDVNNCSKNQSVTISEPDPIIVDTISTTGTSCNSNNGSIEVIAMGGTPSFLYSINGGTNQSSGIFNGLAKGTHLIIVTDNNGCKETKTYVLGKIGELSLSITPNQGICEGDSITLTVNPTGGNAPYQFMWNGGSSSESIMVKPLSQTDYSVTVSNAEGCSSSASTTVSVTKKPITTVSNDQTVCAGTNVILTADGGTSYYWQNGSESSSVTVKPSITTVYTVIAIENGCKGNIASTQVNVLPSPNAIADANKSITFLDQGGYVQFYNYSANTTSYSWNFGDGKTSTEKNPLHQFTTPGIYTVILTTYYNNCSDTDTLTIEVLAVTGINNNINKKEVLLYPNPSNGIVIIETPENTDNYTISIYNSIGELIDTINIVSSQNNKYHLDLSNQINGLYLIKIKNGNNFFTKKLTIIE